MAALFNVIAMPKDNTICGSDFRLNQAYVNYLGQIENIAAALSTFDPDAFETTITDLVNVALAALQNRVYSEYTTFGTFTLPIIPDDDTIPQVTEGTEIISIAITPTSATARIRVSFSGFGAVTSGTTAGTAALFINGANDAVQMSQISGSTQAVLNFDYEYVPGVTSAQTLSVRVGPGAASTMRVNGTTARKGGGVAKSALVASQITT